MVVYITGGSGFLGRQIVKYAKQKGYTVLAPRSSECDLSSLDGTVAWLEKQKAEDRPVEAIVHSAAYYGGLNIVTTEPATMFFKNVRMIHNLFEAAARTGVRKIVSVGSSCSYPALAHDMREEDFWSGPMHDSVVGYGFTKKVQLVAQTVYHQQYGIEGNHVVLTNLYGPFDVFTEYRGHAIAVLIKRYTDASRLGLSEVVNWGDGTAVREFLFVEDAAQVIAEFISMPHDLKPVNVGTGQGVSIRELTELIKELTNYRGDVVWDVNRPNGVPRKVMDVRRLAMLLPEFKPTPLKEGIARTVSWYAANREEASRRK